MSTYCSQYIAKQHLVVKCPSNSASDVDLLRVVHHLSTFLNFDPSSMQYEFEQGKQNQIHIHCIINKLKVLTDLETGKAHAKFKSRPIIYYDVCPKDENNLSPVLIKQIINPKNFTWFLQPVKDMEHYHCLKEYLVKEQITFIDSDPE